MSVTLKDIIDNTSAGSLDSELLNQFCTNQRLTFEHFTREFAEQITEDYLSCNSSWLDCDRAMNALYSYSVAVLGSPLEGDAYQVFRAFDEAEYRRPDDPEEFDHELRTKMILSELATR